MLNNLLKLLVSLVALLLLSIGARWLIAPEGVALEFGYTLADGLGRSSQIGDMAGFFLSGAIFLVLALVTRRKVWYYPTVILLLITAASRSLAWVAHDASLAVAQIGAELVMSAIILAAIRRLPERD